MMYLTNGVLGSTICQAQTEVKKPETVIEKIQEKISKVNQYNADEELHRRISRLENETQMAIIGLCEEIEELKKQINSFAGKAFVLSEKK